MKKNTLLTILGCLLFNIFSADAQGFIIGERKIPIMTIILADPGGTTDPNSSEHTSHGTCEAGIEATIYATNLELFSINSNTNLNPNNSFYLPLGYPAIDIKYTIGSNSGVEHVTDFRYLKTLPTRDGDITVFVHKFIIYTDIEDNCVGANPSQPFDLNYSYSVIDPVGNPATNGEAPYPVCNYIGLNDIFACSFFDFCPGEGENTEEDCNITTATDYFTIDCSDYCPSLAGLENNELSEEENNVKNNDNRSSRNRSFVEDGIKVYPNPFNSRLKILWENNESVSVKSIELFSLSGKLLYQIKNEKLAKEINVTTDLDHLPQGVYFLRINKELSSEIVKLIKQ